MSGRHHEVRHRLFVDEPEGHVLLVGAAVAVGVLVEFGRGADSLGGLDEVHDAGGRGRVEVGARLRNRLRNLLLDRRGLRRPRRLLHAHAFGPVAEQQC